MSVKLDSLDLGKKISGGFSYISPIRSVSTLYMNVPLTDIISSVCFYLFLIKKKKIMSRLKLLVVFLFLKCANRKLDPSNFRRGQR